MRFAIRSAVAGLGLMAMACDQGGAPKAAAPPALVGAWLGDVQFTGGALATMKGLQFLYVYNAGGTMVESSNYDEAPPVPPAYGVWRETGPGRFETKYVFFVTNPPAKFQDLSGGGGWQPNGRGTLTEKVEIAADGQSYRSTIAIEMVDSLGRPAPGGGQGTVKATRISF